MRDGTATNEIAHSEVQGRGVWHFFSKVVGVTHQNADGSDRQKILTDCECFERLELIHEDDNPVDANAIAVCRCNGDQLGHLSAGLATEVVERQQKGYRYGAYLTALTGGKPDRPTIGANILILVAKPGVSDESVKEYIDEVMATDEDLLADLGVDSLCAVRYGEPEGRISIRRSFGGKQGGISGAQLVREWREADFQHGLGEQESKKDKELCLHTEVICARIRSFSAWCWQKTALLACGVDVTLKKTAGEGNEIFYRFLQVLVYLCIPILLMLLVSIGQVR